MVPFGSPVVPEVKCDQAYIVARVGQAAKCRRFVGHQRQQIVGSVPPIGTMRRSNRSLPCGPRDRPSGDDRTARA